MRWVFPYTLFGLFFGGGSGDGNDLLGRGRGRPMISQVAAAAAAAAVADVAAPLWSAFLPAAVQLE